ncbi:LamG domain-containing protein [Candidatus Woesearchaeota archaeon]|nr:LamG domain-containing protein [Candidatus Woesearchaeota archaeon]
MNKRAQAAMEFLMTYGWAILVVIITITALGYFGVVNPGKFLPKTCTFVPGLACNGFVVDEYFTTLVLQNSFGKDITITKINITGTKLTGLYQGEREVKNGKETRFSIKHPPKKVNQKAKAEVHITYQTKDLLNHTIIGDISSSVDKFTASNVLGSNADNLSAYWYFGKGEGNQTIDLSGNENTGSCGMMGGNCPTWTSNNKFGNALNFSLSLIKVPHDQSIYFDNTSQYTWEIWFLGGGTGPIISKGDPYYIQLNINQIGFQYNGESWYEDVLLTQDKWHHLTITYNNGHVELFVNGEYDNGTNIVTINDDSSDLGIASNFQGTIDSILIYNKAFTAEEVKARYETTK